MESMSMGTRSTVKKWILSFCVVQLVFILCATLWLHQNGELWKPPEIFLKTKGILKLTLFSEDSGNANPDTSTSVVQNPLRTLFEDCPSLIQGNSAAIARANEDMKLETRLNSDNAMARLARKCLVFRSIRNYDQHSISDEELFYPIAFSLVVFKDSMQVERLLRAIYRPQNLYCVHVDKKATPEFKRAVRYIVSCFYNVFLAEEQIDVQRGQFSVLEPELICMRELLKSKAKWKYYINLTGQEFPLKTNWELVRILKTFNGTNDIRGLPGPLADTRATHLNMALLPSGQEELVPKKPFPIKLVWMKGSVHIIASREFVDYVLHNRTSLMLLDYLKDSMIPDESFFQTLDNNPELEAPGAGGGPIPSVTRYKVWSDHNKPCGGKYVHGICVVGLDDLKRLVAAPELFVNKVHADYQPYTLDCLEEWYQGRVRAEAGLRDPDLNMTVYTSRMIHPDGQFIS